MKIKTFYSIILLNFVVFSAYAQNFDCNIFEVYVSSSDDLTSIQLESNVGQNEPVNYFWTLIDSEGNMINNNSSNPTFNLIPDSFGLNILCVEASASNPLLGIDISCSFCYDLVFNGNEWVLFDIDDNGEGEGNSNEEELVFIFDCFGEDMELPLGELGMGEDSFFDMLNSDLNNDGFINNLDLEMFYFLLGCNDFEWENENNNPVDSLFNFIVFECNGELISFSPLMLGFNDEEFDLMLEEYEIENSGIGSEENFLAILLGCDESEWNDDLGNEDEVVYENYIFECDSFILTIENDLFGMDIFEFTELLNLDLNQDEIVNEEDIAYLFGCGNDSIDVSLLSAINNGELPEGFLEYINSMMVSGANSFSFADYLNNSQPLDIVDFTNSKELVNITNILGEKVTTKSNQLLFFKYNDGSIEKRMMFNK